MDFARRLPTPPLRDATREQIARIIGAWQQALAQHGGDGGFLFGRFCVADCMYGPVVSRFVTYAIEMPKPVQAYADRMMALPAMKDWGAAAQNEIDAGLA
jgi:glutathione S-transferase